MRIISGTIWNYIMELYQRFYKYIYGHDTCLLQPALSFSLLTENHVSYEWEGAANWGTPHSLHKQERNDAVEEYDTLSLRSHSSCTRRTVNSTVTYSLFIMTQQWYFCKSGVVKLPGLNLPQTLVRLTLCKQLI